MNCLNCHRELEQQDDYCPGCGARVIRKRLTVAGLLGEIMAHFTNFEYGLYRTIIDLTIRPERVTVGFIEGLRKRYLKPGSYLALSLTLSGIIVFFMLRARDQISFDAVAGSQEASHLAKKMFDNINDFQALLFVSYIPMAAIASFLCFPERRFNFAERTAIFTYAVSHLSILTFLPLLLILISDPQDYIAISVYSLPLLFVTMGYYIVRASELSVLEQLPRLLVFLMLMFVFYIGESILILIIFLLTGTLSPQDFLPAAQG